MSLMKEKVIIIGAGLSGLYTALLLQEQYDVTLLEARERMGGRVFGLNGHDLGPSWVWSHHKKILALIEDLGLELFMQHSHGEALYDTPAGVQRFTPPEQAASARIEGGISTLIHALHQKLKPETLHLNTLVTGLKEHEEKIEVFTKHETFYASRVISTLPPRLAQESISYEPQLLEQIQIALQKTPTWMGHSCKCVIEYKEAFWRKQGLSGFVFSPLGPLSEIHDACTSDDAALLGFVHSKSPREGLKEAVLAQLLRLFGEQAAKPTALHILDWTQETLTTTPKDQQGPSSHPDYGLNLSHFHDKLFFSGTETAFSDGGYLEGALQAALTVSQKLLKN